MIVIWRALPVVLLAAILGCSVASAGDQPVTPPERDTDLFSSDTVLELALSADFDALCRPNEDENCDYAPSSLLLYPDSDAQQNIPVEIRVRGGWRARRDHCEVPPLFVRFPAGSAQGTPFAGQSMLPLTTHCRNRRHGVRGASGSDYEQYVLKEYLGYRLYNQVTDRSLRVRLVHIRYSDPSRPGESVERYAFFTEHFDDLAARSGATWSQEKTFDKDRVDLASWDRLALFHFMIGNTDWSVVRERNILLIADAAGRQYPVPYDLDMSGLVDAEYSGVSPRLDFRDPRRRYFLGFCHPEADLPTRISEFDQHRDAMLDTLTDIPGMSRKVRKTARSYLRNFFAILESPRQSRKDIIEACQAWPPSPVDHTTPPDAA